MIDRLISLAAKFGTDAERPDNRHDRLHCQMSRPDQPVDPEFVPRTLGPRPEVNRFRTVRAAASSAEGGGDVSEPARA